MLPFTGLGQYFGFPPLPLEFLAILAALVVAYLGIVEVAKRIFYRRLTVRPE
jgi:Mg2+-importing ATPase